MNINLHQPSNDSFDKDIPTATQCAHRKEVSMIFWIALPVFLVSVPCLSAGSSPWSGFDQNRTLRLSGIFKNLGRGENSLQNQPGGNAEDNAQYLWNVFNQKKIEKFSNDYIENPRNIPNREPFKGKGMYMFFFKCNNMDTNYYPIYYGITSERFRNRMTHSGNEHTVPKMIKARQFTAPGGCDPIEDNLYWTLIECNDHLVSKFIESCFLRTFNFALNREENEQRRTSISLPQYQTSPEASKVHLQTMLNASLKYLYQYIVYQGLQ